MLWFMYSRICALIHLKWNIEKEREIQAIICRQSCIKDASFFNQDES